MLGLKARHRGIVELSEGTVPFEEFSPPGGGGGGLIGGPQARVPLYVPYADFFQYQAGAGRLAGRA